MKQIISFVNVTHRYGEKIVLDKLDFSVDKASIYGIIGSSGCGKTTCLELINGLIAPSEGSIVVDNCEAPGQVAEGVFLRRKMGYCIQGVGLFPHLTVFENISLIGKMEQQSTPARRKKVKHLCEQVRLQFNEVEGKLPNELSGGQRQRVGLARALYMDPKIMLMDEPFAALDPLTRAEIQDLILELQADAGITIVLVTHDIIEAFKMCGEIMLLHHGRVEQRGRPEDLLNSPRTKFVEKYVKVQVY